MKLIYSASVFAFVVFFNSIELSSQSGRGSLNNNIPPPNGRLPPGRHMLGARRPGQSEHPAGHPPIPPHPRPNFGPIPEPGLTESRIPGVAVQEEYLRRAGHPIVHNANQLQNPSIRRKLFDPDNNSPSSSIGSSITPNIEPQSPRK